MTNVLYNEGFYTTLTWMQLGVGLALGLLGVYAFTAMERVTGRRGMINEGNETEGAVDDEPATVRNNPSPFSLTSMRAAYHNLGVLAASRRPVAVGTIVHRVRLAQIARRDKVLLTSAAVRNSLERLLAQGNLRMEARGLAITDAGVELFTKIARLRERGRPEDSSPTKVGPGDEESPARHEAEAQKQGTTSPRIHGSAMRSRHFFPTDILVPRTPLPDGFSVPEMADSSVAGGLRA
ncbi:MAG: hypothetical protein ACO1QR_12010 [Chthoniobacteraceae bacterium]